MKFYESIIPIKKNKTRAIGTGFKTNPSNKFLCAFAFANDIQRLPSNFAIRLTSVDHEVFSQRLLPCVVHVLFSVVKLSHSLWLTNRFLQRQVQQIKVSGILRYGVEKIDFSISTFITNFLLFSQNGTNFQSSGPYRYRVSRIMRGRIGSLIDGYVSLFLQINFYHDQEYR